MIITLAGHVDHGKTAVVQALTGINTDRLKEEQERGLTIDLGFAYTNFGAHRVGFVDVPGHHRFLHNMIAGVANQQHALLVIAADDGIMPQTIEHTQILELLGIQSGTIALNKIDLVDTKLLQQRLEEIHTFQKSCFLQDAPIFNLVASDLKGIASLQAHLSQTAQTFAKYAEERPFRMPIDRSFSLQGVGTVVTGTVASGEIHAADELHLSSSGDRVRIRSVNVQGENATSARVGDRCSLNLAGSSAQSAKRGDWLLAANCEFPMTTVIVDLATLSDFPRRIKHWSSVHVYHHTDHTEGRLVLLNSNSIEPGSESIASLVCEKPMQFKEGDRLILRDRDLSRTIGGATVLSHESIQNRRSFRAQTAYLELLKDNIKANRISQTLFIRARQDLVNIDQFRRFAFCTREQLESTIDSNQFVNSDGHVLAAPALDEIAANLLEKLETYHREFPRREGATIEELASDSKPSMASIQFTFNELIKREKVRSIGGRYTLSSHTALAIDYDKNLFSKVEPMFSAEQPVSLGDVAKRLKIPFHQIERAMRPMMAAGVLVQINKNRYLTPARLSQLQHTASTLASVKPFTVREFRDASGLGRNTVIDLLEYFDRQRITQRRDETRVMLANAGSSTT